jgi:hypothetical protein
MMGSNPKESTMRYNASAFLFVCMITAFARPEHVHASPQDATSTPVATSPVESRVLATNRTSTLERELNAAAEAGFRFAAVMGGETAGGGNEVVAVVTRNSGTTGRYAYKLLATNRTSTMEKELREAADAGYEYRGQTVFNTLLGGREVVVILERNNDALEHSEYRLLATNRTSTLEKELLEAGAAGYVVVGLTVAETAVGGKELVAIVKRRRSS